MTSTRDAQGLAEELRAPLLRDAQALEAGGFASAADIDTAMRLGAGHRAGPFEVLHGSAPEPASAADVTASPFDRVGVVGSGTMATGIAEAIVKGGGDAVLVARSVEAAQRSRGAIAARTAKAVERGKLTDEQAAGLLARLTTSSDLAALEGVDLAVEAVVEHLDVKQSLMRDLEGRLPGVPLATNTSSFRVADVCASMAQSQNALALHFFNPAPAMRLVEVIGHAGTDGRWLDRGHAWARSIGKQTVSCGDAAGFLVNRLLIPYLNDAARTCADRGISVEEADAAVVAGLGHPMGPFALMDLIGLDVMIFALSTMEAAFGDSRFAPCETLHAQVGEGRLGRKSGAGFHRYGGRA